MIEELHDRWWCYKPTEKHKAHYGRFELIECEDRLEIWSLCVLERYRNKGYATRMLTEFLEQFKSEKPLFLHVYKTNEIAIRLYKKVGFAIIGDYRYGDFAYTMQFVGA